MKSERETGNTLLGDTLSGDTLSNGTLVIGLGNPLRGDDGVGMRVASLLASRNLPEGVKVVHGGTRGLELVNWMEGWPRVILIDAAEVGQIPGGFVRFTLDEGQLLGDDQHLSIHAAGLRDALLLAEVLGVLPREVIIYGVQPAHLDWHDALSPQVGAAVPQILQSVLNELGMPDPATRD
jgi:hydrogenase maturation protease